jgi:hypothetical protein
MPPALFSLRLRVAASAEQGGGEGGKNKRNICNEFSVLLCDISVIICTTDISKIAQRSLRFHRVSERTYKTVSILSQYELLPQKIRVQSYRMRF